MTAKDVRKEIEDILSWALADVAILALVFGLGLVVGSHFGRF